MFEGLFTALRDEGVPVALDEWLMLHDALERDLHHSTLSGFYLMSRAVLVKDESHYDGFDVAFARYFSGIEPADDAVDDRVWKWLHENPRFLHISEDQRARLDAMREQMDFDELLEKLKEKLESQEEEHHGGSEHIGTGGTSPFGHSGYHPGGIRVGGEGRWKSAVQTAGERRWRELRTDHEIGARDFGVALRKLRSLSTRLDGPATELDVEDTIRETADQAGQLRLSFRRPRRNTVRVLLMLDIGGSMDEHIMLLDRLFTAMHQASHFRDLQVRFFHNCVYDRVYTRPDMHPKRSESTLHLLAQLDPDYKLVMVGDACMAPTELLVPGGAIDYQYMNEEPGAQWLERLEQHFERAAWLNPHPQRWWETIHGAYTLGIVRQIMPMFELSVGGLDRAVGWLMARR
ncbi:MAG: vWA domain-containing protein [Miltoncostaeaceae bacterium]